MQFNFADTTCKEIIKPNREQPRTPTAGYLKTTSTQGHWILSHAPFVLSESRLLFSPQE